MKSLQRVKERIFSLFLRRLFLIQNVLFLLGFLWIFVLPLNEYSTANRISENALLPGQTNTFFGDNQHNTINAARDLVGNWIEYESTHNDSYQKYEQLSDIFSTMGFPTQIQSYTAVSQGQTLHGYNFYTSLHAPRGDSTEAVLLCAPWKDAEGRINHGGVALLIAFMKYLEGWSLLSKDIVFVVSEDPVTAVSAFMHAYHNIPSKTIEFDSLQFLSGTIQAALALEYPSNSTSFSGIELLYDGINGQLPNLDLINTVVRIANYQFSIPVKIQNKYFYIGQTDSYLPRLDTLIRSMQSQMLASIRGAHAVTLPYRIDAITVRAFQNDHYTLDIRVLGRLLESTLRSLNNLLEHLHQSFFLFLLLEPTRFVSIGNYLPAALLIAASYTISGIQFRLTRDATQSVWISFGHWLVNYVIATLTFMAAHSLKGTQLWFALGSLAGCFFIHTRKLKSAHAHDIMSFTMLFTGLSLAVISTLNFSLSFLLGLWVFPLQVICARFHKSRVAALLWVIPFALPAVFLYAIVPANTEADSFFRKLAIEFDTCSSNYLTYAFFLLLLPSIMATIQRLSRTTVSASPAKKNN
ncbi:GPI-anchor transamidase complex subunit Gaa1 [Schizosaccharomyces japonicus yFS275]|uniref:GPI-anchor transamidase complex subunit Gaa1 n=1 Tax=Schizosaccharomyces japonicus (strain yFS275 / FY16936) TaxID=402676 RepID=B6K3V1_SCHJY|nr:GPI-anchor transamidase complex subunit Gaa1 [Schizosaccharomyces japonicus yFS275]EEB08158.1 GPI-anchor transamidase complex subunit Gaa1 [Schizosaccharomyces japonicus yFS275]